MTTGFMFERESICTCPRFLHWYVTDGGTLVCQCGHAMDEHLDCYGSCVGEVTIK